MSIMLNETTYPIDENTFEGMYVKSNLQYGWVLTGKDREQGNLYVLRGYATKFLNDDFLYGNVSSLLESGLSGWQGQRIPGCVGLSWGGHTAEEVQQALDRHVAKLSGVEDREWLIGLAGRANGSWSGCRVSIDDDELGIFRLMSKADFVPTNIPRRKR